MKPILLIPMLGKGQRFVDAGFKIPKQLVNIKNSTMIEVSLNCIKLSDFDLIFIVRQEHVINFKIDFFLKDKFGENIKIIIYDKETEGTLSTCLLAKDFFKNRPLLITTLDVYFEPQLEFNKIEKTVDGTILVFESNNSSYSFSKVNEYGYVTETAEKKQISNLASVGLYYFKSSDDFVNFSKKMINDNIRTNNEFYLCPLYNLLIGDNKKISTIKVDTCLPLGTPEEIDFFLNM